MPPSTGATVAERRTSVTPKVQETSVMEIAVKAPSTTSESEGDVRRRRGREEEDADPGAAAHPVYEADPEGGERRARRVATVLRRMAMADEQPQGQEDDQRADGRLRSALHRLGQKRLRQDDRHAEGLRA